MKVKRKRPHAEYRAQYDIDVGINDVIWENVRELMRQRYGEENINRLARDAKIGPATVQGIKDKVRSVRVGTVEKIARAFRVEPWQLLAHGAVDKDFLTVLQAWRQPGEQPRRMLLGAARGALGNGPTTAERPVEPSRRRQ